jgi:hypothetical protein
MSIPKHELCVLPVQTDIPVFGCDAKRVITLALLNKRNGSLSARLARPFWIELRAVVKPLALTARRLWKLVRWQII